MVVLFTNLVVLLKAPCGLFWSFSLHSSSLESGLGGIEISQILVLENRILVLFSKGQETLEILKKRY